MGRRGWTVDQKLEIVLAGLAPGVNLSVCREYAILQHNTIGTLKQQNSVRVFLDFP